MPKKYRQMNNQQLLELQQQGGVLVDIRREDEWRLTGVVEGSLLLTYFADDGSSDPYQWLQQLDRLVPKHKPLALICRSGYRTSLICEFLTETSARRDIYNVSEGILGWLAAGLPVIPPDNLLESAGKSHLRTVTT